MKAETFRQAGGMIERRRNRGLDLDRERLGMAHLGIVGPETPLRTMMMSSGRREIHAFVGRPWYEVRLSGQLLYRGGDRIEAHAILRMHTGAQLVGSEI